MQSLICFVCIRNHLRSIAFLSFLQFLGFMADLSSTVMLSCFDKKHSQMTIASFRNSQFDFLFTTGILSWYQSQV